MSLSLSCTIYTRVSVFIANLSALFVTITWKYQNQHQRAYPGKGHQDRVGITTVFFVDGIITNYIKGDVC